MAITAALKRSALEDCWDTLKASGITLRDALRQQEKEARTAIASGSMRSVAGLGRSSVMATHGPGEITTTETVELYRWLIDFFGQSLQWLNFAANYGLDAFQVELGGRPTTLGALVANPVVLDLTTRWVILCTEYGIDPGEVINAAVNDTSIFLWMMYHIISVVEWQPNFLWARVPIGIGIRQ